jgi:hypothetical protein
MFLLVFAWAISIAIVHMHVYSRAPTEELEILERLMTNALRMSQGWIPQIVNSPECVRVLRNWYPLILSYPTLFQ